MSQHAYGTASGVSSRTAILLSSNSSDKSAVKIPGQSIQLETIRVLFSVALPGSVTFYLAEDEAGNAPITSEFSATPFQGNAGTVGAVVASLLFRYSRTNKGTPGKLWLIITPNTSTTVEAYLHFTKAA